jgi:hypothetical protein
MSRYANAYLGMQGTRPFRFAPHQLLDAHCRANGLEVLKEPIPYCLVRDGAVDLQTYGEVVNYFMRTENRTNQLYVEMNRR